MEKTNAEGMVPEPQQIYSDSGGKPVRVLTLAENVQTGEAEVVFERLTPPYAVCCCLLRRFQADFTSGKPAEEEKAPAEEAPVTNSREETSIPSDRPAIRKSVIPADRMREEKMLREEKKEEGQPSQEEQPQEEQENEQAADLDPGLEAFLDAKGLDEKLEVLGTVKESADHRMVDIMAASMDIEVSGEDVAERIEKLRDAMLTRRKYELTRAERPK